MTDPTLTATERQLAGDLWEAALEALEEANREGLTSREPFRKLARAMHASADAFRPACLPYRAAVDRYGQAGADDLVRRGYILAPPADDTLDDNWDGGD